MGTFADIVKNVGTAVSTRVTGANYYDYPPDSPSQFPAIIVTLVSVDPTPVFSGNSFEGTLRITCITERAENREAWVRLYSYMDSTGSGTSVLAALRADPRFGSAVDSSEIARVENIGKRELGGGFYIGFDVLVPFIRAVP